MTVAVEPVELRDALVELLADRVREPAEVVNYHASLGSAAGELHLLRWGTCVVGRFREPGDLVAELLAQLAGHGAVPPGCIRVRSVAVAGPSGAVVLPEGHRRRLAELATPLARRGMRVVRGPFVDLDPISFVVHEPPARFGEVDAADVLGAVGSTGSSTREPVTDPRVVGWPVRRVDDDRAAAAMERAGTIVDAPVDALAVIRLILGPDGGWPTPGVDWRRELVDQLVSLTGAEGPDR